MKCEVKKKMNEKETAACSIYLSKLLKLGKAITFPRNTEIS
jgi:hypothetical protein